MDPFSTALPTVYELICIANPLAQCSSPTASIATAAVVPDYTTSQLTE
jgi:hypothetical protein